MNKLIKLAVLSLSSSLACAGPVTLKGDIDVHVKPKHSMQGKNPDLVFKLPQYELSADAGNYLHQQLAQYPKNKVNTIASDLPRKISLGMQLTPVLDQGAHGSCVTFAVTAAIDAALGAGDYISQLCNLELGSYLAINDRIEYSGWNGSWAHIVLDQINEYGIISQNYQKLQGCAGVRAYPKYDENNEGKPMADTDFLRHSIPVSHLIGSYPVLQMENAFSAGVDKDLVIQQMKNELAKGNRLLVGMFLDVYVGSAGAVGSNNAAYDTWMLNPEIIADAVKGYIYAGHELVITGYNDDIVVVDDNGYSNQGVFILRNSWSKEAGDEGDYYVSYDYVKLLADDVYAVNLKK